MSSTVLEDNFLSLKAFKNTVSALIINGKWPILLEDLQALYPQFTPEKICQITNTELNLTIDGGSFKGTPKLSNEQLITAIFNIKGRAMSPEEMTDHIKAIFGKHVPVRSIRNILARMDEALIVERGVYNSYSNLGIQNDDIGQLRDTCFTYLQGVSQFMSAAKLLENAPKIVQGVTNSSYTLMGILQDDPRFITKRGLMIG